MKEAQEKAKLRKELKTEELVYRVEDLESELKKTQDLLTRVLYILKRMKLDS
jgi:hypothetical protein